MNKQETTREAFGFGALESPPDSRDLQLGTVQAPGKYPEEYLPDYSQLEIYYQNGQPACGGHAGSWLTQGFEYIENGQVVKLSPRFIYALCKKIDGIPDVEGTYLRAIMKVLQTYGVCKDELFPNDVSLPKDVYKDWTLIPQEAFDDALPRKIKNYAFITNPSDLETLKQATYQNSFVLVLKRPWVPQKYPDGHFIVLNGYNSKERYANSFGKNWGDNGYGWFDQNDCSTIIEAATAVDLPDQEVKDLIKKRDLLTYLRDLYRKLLWLKGIKPLV